MLNKVKDCFRKGKVFYTFHAKEEMRNERFGIIKDAEVYEAVLSCEVIESYPDDEPYPSCLVYGKTVKRRPLHIVCAYSETERLTIVVTVYQPDKNIWIDFKRRRK